MKNLGLFRKERRFCHFTGRGICKNGWGLWRTWMETEFAKGKRKKIEKDRNGGNEDVSEML